MLAGTGLRAEGAEAKGHDYTRIARQVKWSPLAKKGSTVLKAFAFAEPPERLEVVGCMTPSTPHEKSKFWGSGRSMVPRLKLEGIDGWAGVEQFHSTREFSPGLDIVRIVRLIPLSWFNL